MSNILYQLPYLLITSISWKFALTSPVCEIFNDANQPHQTSCKLDSKIPNMSWSSQLLPNPIILYKKHTDMSSSENQRYSIISKKQNSTATEYSQFVEHSIAKRSYSHVTM